MRDMVLLTSVTPASSGCVLLSWDDGVTREVDLSDMILGHPILEMLQIPEVFRDVRLVEGGSGIEWPNGADFCARALRLHSDNQMQKTKADA